VTRPPVWVYALARRFWDEAGDAPPFPRDLRDALRWIARVHVLDVPDLTLARAADALAGFGVNFDRARPDRALAGCFSGFRGHGYILFDPLLSPAEVRFTLAHETAHWLRDYDDPRHKVLKRLGANALEVLDGLRAPTPEERFAGVLRAVPVGPFAHVLDRDRFGRVCSAGARDSEAAADRLAFELLAPLEALRPHLGNEVAALTSVFGLPEPEALRYAAALGR
jgi:Zn-dependent protease with chaperone function